MCICVSVCIYIYKAVTQFPSHLGHILSIHLFLSPFLSVYIDTQQF